jgi:cytochrome P450
MEYELLTDRDTVTTHEHPLLDFNRDEVQQFGHGPISLPAYFPFGAGPQACIGGQMPLAEAQLVLAAIVAQFDFDIDARRLDDLRPAGVLQPRGGMPAIVTPATE